MGTKTRNEMIRGIIRDYGLGAIILWRPDELVMSLGYQPYLGLSFGVFTEAKTFLFIPENEPEPYMREKAKIRRYGAGMTEENPWDTLFAQMKNELESLELGECPIGCIRAVGGSSLTTCAAEQPALPDNLLDRLDGLGGGICRKSEAAIKALYDEKLGEDVEALRLAHQAAAEGVKAFYDALIEAVSEIQVQCAVEHAIACCTGKNGVRFARGWAQIQSGGRSTQAGKYNTTTGKLLERGDLVLMELGVCVNGYWADLTRTGYVGVMPEQVRQRYDLVAQAQKAAIDRIKPGVPANEIYEAAAEVFARKNCLHLFTHALGHGVGFRYHEFAPSLVPYNRAPLKENMVLTVEPGIYQEGFGGIRIEDNLLVTKDGCEILSAAAIKIP